MERRANRRGRVAGVKTFTYYAYDRFNYGGPFVHHFTREVSRTLAGRENHTLSELATVINDEPSALPYLERIQRAGGFRKYETLVTKSLARIFIPKFPQLPAEVIPTIVQFWAHVGDY